MKKCLSFFLAVMMIATCLSVFAVSGFAAEPIKCGYLCTEMVTKGSNGDTEITKYIYDENDNLIQEFCEFSDGASVKHTYTYGNNGLLIEHIHIEEESGAYLGIEIYDYDESGNIISYVDEDRCAEQYTYDNSGCLVRKIKNSGVRFEYAYIYDENGHLVKETSVGTNQSSSNTVYDYDNDGYLIKKTFSGETTNGYFGPEVTTYSYDNKRNLTECKSVNRSGDLISKNTYEYDDNGYVIREESTDSFEHMQQYDYSYDNNGNLVKCIIETEEETYTKTYIYKETDKKIYRYCEGGSLISIIYKNTFPFSGNQVCPHPVVLSGNSSFLLPGVDYRISYKDNSDMGTGIILFSTLMYSTELPFTIAEEPASETEALLTTDPDEITSVQDENTTSWYNEYPSTASSDNSKSLALPIVIVFSVVLIVIVVIVSRRKKH